MNKIEKLAKRIFEAQHAYYNLGTPILSDQAYDSLVDELKQLDANHPAITSVGAETKVSEWEKRSHKIPAGSLDKVNTPAEFTKWVNDHASAQQFVSMDKIDGLTICLSYEDGLLTEAITRGNGLIGENLYQNVKRMEGITSKLSSKFSGIIRGEIVLKTQVWKNSFPDLTNPRNGAVGISKRLDGTDVDKLSVICYQAIGDVSFKTEIEQLKWLDKEGFLTPKYKLCKTTEEVIALWNDYQSSIRATLPYEIDGLVIRINNLEFQDSLGETNLRPKGAKAFKFDAETKITKVKAINWQVGNSGRITPVAEVESVFLAGANIERVSLHNYSNVKELEIDVGAEVLLKRANEVIPYITEVVTKTGTIVKAPASCPDCKSKLSWKGEYLSCNNLDCASQVWGRIRNWIKVHNILEIGETLTTRLIESKLVLDPADLYTLKAKDIAELDRMGEKSAQNVIDSIAKSIPTTLSKFISGLSIPGIGESSIKLLESVNISNLDALLKATLTDFIITDGFGEVKAKSLFDGLKQNKKLIQKLLDNKVEIKDLSQNKLYGKSFCFTGAMENKRALLEKMVSDNGGTVKGSVSKGLDYLVINDLNSTSSKAQAAKKNGTNLLSEKEFLKLI